MFHVEQQQCWEHLSEKVLDVPLRADMPERVGLRRREPGMLNTAAMVSLSSPRRCRLTSMPLLPPVVLLHKVLEGMTTFL